MSGRDLSPLTFEAPERAGPATDAVPAGSLARRAMLVWALARLPAVALLIYLLRHPILDAIERRFDIFRVTQFVIGLLSTPVARILCGAALFAVLLLVVVRVERLRPAAAYALLVATAASVIALLCAVTATSPTRGLLVWLILAVNVAPIHLLRWPRRYPRRWDALMLANVGVAELFLWREYRRWVRCQLLGRSGDDRRAGFGLSPALPGLLLASFAFAVLAGGGKLVAFEQTIRMPGEATLVERGRSFNWIELDATGKYLYVTGHGIPFLRRYDLRHLSAPPMTSHVPTGGAQGFAYDSRAGELYVFNTSANQLLFFDAATLGVRRALEVPGLSPGDPWIVVDPLSNTLTVVSEADLETGVPFVVLDRSTGHALDRQNLDAGNVLKHPARPWLYLSFFRRRQQVVLYDLRTRRVAHSAPADARAERMVFWEAANELLVTSPMESRIMRFDGDDLHPKGHFSAPFGARAIALDERRGLLLCGNLATGVLVSIELRTGRRLRSAYLGPWLRTIALEVETGTAYVSSNGALYRFTYATETSKAEP